MKKQVMLYNVYNDDCRCIMYHATAEEVAHATGFSGTHIRKVANTGVKVGGKYRIRHAQDCEPTERDYTEKEARQKFGDENYEEWCEMNRRYGGITRRLQKK